MHDAVIMGVLQCIAYGRHDGECLLGREATSAHGLTQIDAIDEFHQQEVEALRVAEVVNGHDVRMAQHGECLRFLRKALGKR